MPKDAFYFSHDSNSRNDPKIMALIKTYGLQGYGCFWVIIETLSEQTEYKLPHKQWVNDALAMAMLCDYDSATKFINDCINQYELLKSDGEYFWSDSLLRRMKLKEDKRQKRIEAGKKGAENRWKDSNAIANPKQSHSNGIAKHGKGKEKKVKEKKDNIYTPEFESWYSSWPRSQAKEDSAKNFAKRQKEHGLEFILQCSKNYLSFLDSFPEDKKPYAYSSNNFFGQKAYYLDYKEQKQSKPQAPRLFDELGDPIPGARDTNPI